MSVLFIDIETQRTNDPKVIKRLQDAVEPPGQYKKADSIAEWHRTQGAAARAEAVAKTALDGTYGRLATIGYAFDGDVIVLCNEGADEKALLTDFEIVLRPAPGHTFDLVAFNGEFDFRFLMKRYVINGLPIPHQVQRALGTRDGFYDPMRAWEGYKGYIAQAELEKVLGITRSDDIDGSQVGEAIDAGDWARVINHNREDIVCLREIYRRMVA